MLPASSRMPARCGLITFLCAVLFSLPVRAQAGDRNPSFLGAIDITPISSTPEGRFEIRLYHKNGEDLTSYLSRNRSYTAVTVNGYIAVTSRGYSFPRKSGNDTQPSFVHNFNHEVFAKLRQKIITTYGQQPDASDLVSFVNGYIEKKDYRRGFDVASQVAETREGDCTEHATLLVSLMRMFKIPSKMVLGIKMFRDGGHYLAFGHAWVEYVDHGTWRAADPTLASEVDGSYLPTGTLEDEGLNFSLDLISILQRLPYRIEISGPW